MEDVRLGLVKAVVVIFCILQNSTQGTELVQSFQWFKQCIGPNWTSLSEARDE